MKVIIKNEPVRYVKFDKGEEVKVDDILKLWFEFEDTSQELRSYEISCGGDILKILTKYKFLYNWTGSRMADMYKLSDEFEKLIDVIKEENND